MLTFSPSRTYSEKYFKTIFEVRQQMCTQTHPYKQIKQNSRTPLLALKDPSHWKNYDTHSQFEVVHGREAT